MREELAKSQRLVARIGARQHGLVSYEQLLWAGMARSTVSRRVCEGWLHRVHRGVNAVGHTNLSQEGEWLAAVMACGDSAVLSHESAAHLWGISPTSPSTIHVSVPATNGRARRQGIRLHYSTTLTSADIARRRSIPVTSHARTLADLGYDREPTRSGLERRFLRLCRDHGIPKPEVNVKVGRFTVDFLWRNERLVVELDSYAYHSDRATFRSDRARDRELKRLGFAVLRFVDRDLNEEPLAIVSSLQAHLRGVRPRLDEAPPE